MPLLQLGPHHLLELDLEIAFQPPSSIAPGRPFPRPVAFRFKPSLHVIGTDRIGVYPWIPPEGESLRFEVKFVRRAGDSHISRSPLRTVHTRPLTDILSNRINTLSDGNANSSIDISREDLYRRMAGSFYLWGSNYRAVRVPGAYRLQISGYLKRSNGSTILLARTESNPIHVNFNNLPIESPESTESFVNRLTEYGRTHRVRYTQRMVNIGGRSVSLLLAKSSQVT
jgi:hypothetical protein